MRKLTLNTVIQEYRKNDPEFEKHYQKELWINEIASMIVRLRKRAHLTQIELADKANTTQPVIARLESGSDTRIPSLALLARIATALHVRLYIGFKETNGDLSTV